MSGWKAKLVRETPPKDHAYAVFAYKSGGGYRTEMAGTISLRKAKLIQAVMNMPDTELTQVYSDMGIDNKEGK